MRDISYNPEKWHCLAGKVGEGSPDLRGKGENFKMEDFSEADTHKILPFIPYEIPNHTHYSFLSSDIAEVHWKYFVVK